MSKHKVTRYDEGGDVEDDTSALTEYTPPKSMPRRPVSRTPESEPSRTSGPGRKPTGPSSRGTTDTEPRDRFGIPGKVGSPSAPGPRTIDSSELERNLSAAGNATGASAAIQGVRRGAAVGKGLAEFAAGRAGAKEAPAAVSAARGALDRAMSAERAAPKTGDMAKIGDALKAFKNKPAAKSTPKPKPKPMTAAERDAISRADTLDEFGGAMKRGGSVKRYASGGSISSASSRGDGIAQRGKTRGTLMCSGGMAKGRK